MSGRKTLFMKFALKALHSERILKMRVEVMLVWKLMDLLAHVFPVLFFALRTHLTVVRVSFPNGINHLKNNQQKSHLVLANIDCHEAKPIISD